MKIFATPNMETHIYRKLQIIFYVPEVTDFGVVESLENVYEGIIYTLHTDLQDTNYRQKKMAQQ